MDNEKEIKKESNRIKEERRRDEQDEVLNPTSEAMETGDSKTSATRNTSNYDEFGSKKAGPSGYGDRSAQPLTNRKIDQDKEERESELEKSEERKEEKLKEREERRKDWNE